MRGFRVILAALMLVVSPALAAQPTKPSLLNGFQIGGTSRATFCKVQSSGVDPALRDVFDRAWSIVCPDAADAVGQIHALRTNRDDAIDRLDALRTSRVRCEAGSALIDIHELEGVNQRVCSLTEADVEYIVYSTQKGRIAYSAEGLAGYDSALRLALRSIVADKIIPGDLDIAVTGAGDPAAFARVQAGTQDPGGALEEAYRRNNSGSYAEAAEFFSALLERAEGDPNSAQLVGEILVNNALQKSNLGTWAEADLLFAQADAIPTSDPVQLRLRRNFGALHLLNQNYYEAARALLEEPLRLTMSDATSDQLMISESAAAAINSADPVARRLNGTLSPLTSEERSRILDDQAAILLAVIDRVEGRSQIARTAIEAALADLRQIRGGLVTSAARLQAQGMSELGLLAEQFGDAAAAEEHFRNAVEILAYEYPNSVAVAAVNARLAAFLARSGRTEEALSIYRAIVERGSAQLIANNISADMLAPYFSLLADRIPEDPTLANDFFLASATLVRPGVAQTQAVLARQFSGGSDDSARLFRQAVALTRDVERTRVELSRIRSRGQTSENQALVKALEENLIAAQRAQVESQAQLAQVPRYRAISSRPMTLEELQDVLDEGEAYYKLVEVGSALYGEFITDRKTRIWKLPISSRQLEEAVLTLRSSIVIEEGGQYNTYPFDAEVAVKLYLSLFSEVTDDLSGIRHLVFEPDGAMLRLPLNLLIEDAGSVEAYIRRRADPEADAFDMRGVAWLGRNRDISTATSAEAFRDLRRVTPSRALHQYLGLGANAPVGDLLPRNTVRAGTPGVDCSWRPATWNQPISSAELLIASEAVSGGGDDALLLTGQSFTDTALLGRSDLENYRILHFATHGLVTPPRPGCSINPALVTSFGEGDSDGLLSFAEIFDLSLDADLVILSACDTAGQAGLGSTAEAGLTTGGRSELDGLVRAFVGAGGRLVIASHWPVPDSYDATKRLISGLFAASPGTPTASALRQAQLSLMADAATSHPYYWSGFAVVGDGAVPVVRTLPSVSTLQTN